MIVLYSKQIQFNTYLFYMVASVAMSISSTVAQNRVCFIEAKVSTIDDPKKKVGAAMQYIQITKRRKYLLRKALHVDEKSKLTGQQEHSERKHINCQS